MTKSVDPMKVPCSQKACDALLKEPKGTTAAAIRLGAPKRAGGHAVPNAIREWLDAPPVQLEPIAGPDGAAMLSLDWALVAIEAVRGLFRPTKKKRSIDCDEDCLARWAPSARWKAVGPHVRVRVEVARARDGSTREAVVVRCGACLGKLARIAVRPFKGLLKVHGSVPRITVRRRSKEERAQDQQNATMRVGASA